MSKLICFLVLTVMLFGLTACPYCNCDNVQPVNLQDIPEEVVAKLYYKNDTVYLFKHSSGTLVEYQSDVQFTDSDLQKFSCDCLQIINNEQHYKTSLTSETNAPDISCKLNNLKEPYYPLRIGIWKILFEIPLSEEDAGNEPPMLDELVIDGRTYHNVYTLHNPNAGLKQIDIDSLYYNHEFGIIKITKTNDEYFIRQD